MITGDDFANSLNSIILYKKISFKNYLSTEGTCY